MGAESEPAPTVFVVEDDSALRDALSALFQSVGLPVQTFGSGQEFLDRGVDGRPGCLLLDLRLPGMSGLEVQRRLSEAGVDVPVLFMTGYGDVASAVRAMQQGAFDFLEKPCNGQHLLDRVHAALARDAQSRHALLRKRQTEVRLASLTASERQVLDMMLEGKPYKVIARELEISYKTVEARRGRLMKKLQCEGLPQLFRMMLTNGVSG